MCFNVVRSDSFVWLWPSSNEFLKSRWRTVLALCVFLEKRGTRARLQKIISKSSCKADKTLYCALPITAVFIEGRLKRSELTVAFWGKPNKMRQPILRGKSQTATSKSWIYRLQIARNSIKYASTSERTSETLFKKLIKQCVWVLELEVDRFSDKHTCINLFSSFAIVWAQNISWNIQGLLTEEFDHGSDWTLAAGLRHASRTVTTLAC